MDFFFEEGYEFGYFRTDILERTVILRDQAVLPESTLVSTTTLHERDELDELFVIGSPYLLFN